MMVKAGLYCLIVMGMFFYISWKMSIFTLGIMLPTMFFGPIYGKAMRRIRKEISDNQADASNVAEEAFSNIRTVKAFATEDRECNEYSLRNEKVFLKAKEQALYYGFFSFVMQFVMFGSLDAMVYFASYLNTEGELTIGEFTSFQFYMFSFLINFMTFTSVIGEVMGVFGTAAGIANIFLYKSTILVDGGDQVSKATEEGGNVSLQNIEFTYPTK